jgi:hypothetical protein
MKSKIIIFWALFVLTCLSVHAQTLSPSVISAGGGYTTGGTGSLSYTIAEMTMVETFTKGSTILSQGFQQPELHTISNTDLELAPCDIIMFPNPTSGQITLSYLSGASTQNSVKIYNLLGAVILSETYIAKDGLNNLTFGLSQYSGGTYFLELVTEHQGRKIAGAYKINLVN